MSEGALLLELARKAIETRFTKKELELDQYTHLNEKKGIFVTINKEEELRGCIGFPKAEIELYKGVIKAARAAAFDDPRFPPLEAEELGEIRIEVTLLTEAAPIEVERPAEYLEKIKVGRDGLIIKQGFHCGLLLPQVPVEYGWNVETYLEQLCRKAGLPIDAWKDPKTRIEAFQGTVYTE